MAYPTRQIGALPPETLVQRFPVLAKLVSEHSRLRHEQGSARVALDRLLDARSAAEVADAAAYAEALRAGQPDPGPVAVTAADAAIAAERRRVDGLRTAIESVEGELAAAVKKGRGTWRTPLLERAAKARADLVATVEAWASTRSELADLESLVAWLDGFEARPTFTVRQPRIGGMTLPAIIGHLSDDAGGVSAGQSHGESVNGQPTREADGVAVA